MLSYQLNKMKKNTIYSSVICPNWESPRSKVECRRLQ